jgi:hypothetical protein
MLLTMQKDNYFSKKKMTHIMIKPYYLILIIVLLANCTSNSHKELDYKMVKAEFKSLDCEPETNACLMVTIAYPRFDTGDSLAIFLANRIVKNSILDNIGMGDVESTDDLGIEEAIESLNKNFEELKRDFNDYATGWQAHINTRELYQSDSILVLEIASMTYFGGAHPNSNIRYFNFNRETGSYLPISAFIRDLEQFTAKAEVVFKKAYNIKEGTSYDDAGFNFLGDKFIISANYAYLGDSIRLHYNKYEISSYVAGEFEIMVALN